MRTPTEDNPLRVVELFSGIGAQAMALKLQGIPYRVVGTSEIDSHAMTSYEAIHGPVNQLGDITKLEHLPECDLVTYSFPCLTGDMPVLTSKGYRHIRDIEPGDCVYSQDGRYHRVLASGCTGTHPTYRLKVEGHDEIRCTKDHLFWCNHNVMPDDWATCSSLKEGSRIAVVDGVAEGEASTSLSTVVYMKPTNYSENVYDLTVEGTSTFVVNGVLTHNCQDLSIAGYQRGMVKGSGTRSALLWEVGRLLEDAVDNGHAPDCLLMENVYAILNKKNIESFEQWIKFLDDLGYTSSYEVLNATYFGVPQNRKRCFMVSAHDGRKFIFPRGEPTTKRLKDVLEEDVPESFYLSDEKIALYEAHKKRHDAQGHGLGWQPRTPEDEGRALTALPSRHSQNFLITQGSMAEWRAEHETDGSDPGDVPAEPSIELAGNLPTTNYDMMNRVYGTEGVAPTLRTMATGGGQMPKIEVSGQTEPKSVIAGYVPETFDQGKRVYDTDGVSPCVVSCNGGNRMPKIEVKGIVADEPSVKYAGKLDVKFEQDSRVHDVEGVAPTIRASKGQCHSPMIEESTEDDTTQDIVTVSGKDSGIIIAGKLKDSFAQDSRVHDVNGASPTIMSTRPTHPPMILDGEGGDSDE